MTVLVEHDNGIRGLYRIGKHTITTLDDLPKLIQKYVQAGSCIYQLEILPNREGKSWT